MKNVTLYANNERLEHHRAHLIASVSSYDPDRNTQRWSELTLYQTARGQMLCQETGHSVVPGEVTRYQLMRACAPHELVQRVGYGWLAKRLYDASGIAHAQVIDAPPAPGDPSGCHLFCDDTPDLLFRGRKIFSVSTDRNERNRWTELHLYRLHSGKLVCHELGCTRVDGEITRHQGHIATAPAELMAHLGLGRLARELYAEIGWARVPEHPVHKRRMIRIAA